jgi:hypothetical protein
VHANGVVAGFDGPQNGTALGRDRRKRQGLCNGSHIVCIGRWKAHLRCGPPARAGAVRPAGGGRSVAGERRAAASAPSRLYQGETCIAGKRQRRMP